MVVVFSATFTINVLQITDTEEIPVEKAAVGGWTVFFFLRHLFFSLLRWVDKWTNRGTEEHAEHPLADRESVPACGGCDCKLRLHCHRSHLLC